MGRAEGGRWPLHGLVHSIRVAVGVVTVLTVSGTTTIPCRTCKKYACWLTCGAFLLVRNVHSIVPKRLVWVLHSAVYEHIGEHQCK